MRTANIATIPSRVNELAKMLKSIEGQFDEIRIYANGFNAIPKWMKNYTVSSGDDLTDNGKFFFLSKLKQREIYFTLDDDIIYPSTYADDMVKAIDEYRSIVTHHGRILNGHNLSYYCGHKVFHFANNQTELREIDVAGTGTMAFDTNYFCPKNLHKSKDKCMSDLLIGLETIKKNKKIIVLPHQCGYFKPMLTDSSIFKSHINNEKRQIELSNKIFSKKNSNVTK